MTGESIDELRSRSVAEAKDASDDALGAHRALLSAGTGEAAAAHRVAIAPIYRGELEAAEAMLAELIVSRPDIAIARRRLDELRSARGTDVRRAAARPVAGRLVVVGSA